MELSGSESATGSIDATRQSPGDTRSASISHEDSQAFETALGSQHQEEPKGQSHDAPSLKTLPNELHTKILQEVMHAPPGAANQAAAFRSARNLTHASPDYLRLVAGNTGAPAAEFQQLASNTAPQRAREAFRGHVNSLNEATNKSERRQKINVIRDAADKEYRNPDAQLHTLEAAFLADRTAESVDYHRNANIFTRWGRHPTADTVQRAMDATHGGPNAATTAAVLRNDPRADPRLNNRLASPERLSQMRDHANSDPNFVRARNVQLGQTIRPRDGVDPAWFESHAFRTTRPQDAVRDYVASPARGNLFRDLS